MLALGAYVMSLPLLSLGQSNESSAQIQGMSGMNVAEGMVVFLDIFGA